MISHSLGSLIRDVIDAMSCREACGMGQSNRELPCSIQLRSTSAGEPNLSMIEDKG